MGILSSCCRRRKPEHDASERDPLLPKHRTIPSSPSSDSQRSLLEKLAEAATAINAGKLPTTAQVTHIIDLCLETEFLKLQAKQYSTAVSGTSMPGGYPEGGPVSASGRAVLGGLREVLESVREWGAEMNSDDRIQEFLFLASRISQDGRPPVRVEVPDELVDKGKDTVDVVMQTTSEISEDLTTIASSLRSLLIHLLSSTALRVLLSDFLIAAREMTAEVAASVAVVAKQVEVAAEDVEGAAMEVTSVEGLKGKARETLVDVAQAGVERKGLAEIAEEEGEKTKQRVLHRVQEVLYQAHQNPDEQQALLTILSLCRKYAQNASTLVAPDINSEDANTPDVKPRVSASPTLSKELSHLKVLLERLASGRSLDPIIRLLTSTTQHAMHPTTRTPTQDPTHPKSDPSNAALHDYLHRLSTFFYMALISPPYVQTTAFTTDCSALYDDGRSLLHDSRDAPWASELRALISESSAFVKAVENDAKTLRLLAALHTIRDAGLAFVRDAALGVTRGAAGAKKRVAEEVRKDLVRWLVRGVLARVSRLPMPRVEVVMGKVEGAVDALWLRAGGGESHPVKTYGATDVEEPLGRGLVPDRMWVRSWNELRVDMNVEDAASRYAGTGQSLLGQSQVHAATRMNLHLDGVRLSARDIAYYFRYKNILGLSAVDYSDEGLLSVDLGDGVTIDMDLEMGSTVEDEERQHVGEEELDSSNAAEPIFKVHSVDVALPGLFFTIDRSKHYILNKTLLQPLSGPLVRTFASRALSQQLSAGLERVAQVGGEVKKEAERMGTGRVRIVVGALEEERRRGNVGLRVDDKELDESPRTEEWMKAMYRKLPLLLPPQPETPPSQDVHIESHTTATIKGVVYTSITAHDSPDAEPAPAPGPHSARPSHSGGGEHNMTSAANDPSNSPDVDKTIIAVGAGPQLFPHHGGPYGEDITEGALVPEPHTGVKGIISDATKVARGVSDDAMVEGTRVAEDRAKAVGEGASAAEEGVKGGAREAERVRADFERAGQRRGERWKKEMGSEGWKSDAFVF